MASNNQQGNPGYDPYLSDDFFMGSQPTPQQQPPIQQGGKGKKGKKPKKVQTATERVKSLSRLAAVCAGIAVIGCGIGIWGTFNGQRIANDAKADPVKVVVTSSDLARGAEITDDSITSVEVPKAYRSSGAIPWDERDSIVGKRTATAMSSGSQVSLNDIQGSGSKSSLSQSIPDGHEAVTIEVNSVSGMSNLIKIGDKVRVIEINPDTYEIKDIIVATVVALGSNLYDGGEGEYSTITVDVSPDIATRIRLAQNNGNIVTCVLEPYSQSDLVAGGQENPNKTTKTEDAINGYSSSVGSLVGQ